MTEKDQRVKEIRERLLHPIFLKEPGKHLQSGQARDDIKYLLSLLSEKEKKVEELEEGIEELLCNFSEYLPPNVFEGLNKLLKK